MIFSRPELLPLLCLPILFGFWSWLRRGRPVVLPYDHGDMRRGRVLDYLVRIAGLLPAGLAAIALLLWSGPLREGPPTYPAQVANIQLALDTSGSMKDQLGDKLKPDGTVKLAVNCAAWPIVPTKPPCFRIRPTIPSTLTSTRMKLICRDSPAARSNG